MRNLWRRLRLYRRLALETLVVAGVLAVLLAAALGLNYWLTDAIRAGHQPYRHRPQGNRRLTK